MISRPRSRSSGSMTKLIVDQAAAGNRIDHYLASALPDLSRSRIQQLIKQGQVSIKQRPVKKSYLVQAGDVIRVELPPKTEEEALTPQALPLDIVYEDEAIAIINKARGMVVHPAPGHPSDTLVHGLLYHFEDLAQAESRRPGIVHRMDKDTTGLLVVTKTDAAHRYFLDLFKRHDIDRTYWALVHGRVGFSQRTIDLPIGRSPTNRKRFAIDPLGRRAVTHIETIEVFDQHSLLACRLETGRTHQIRVHLQSIHHPIVGDPVYGPRKAEYRRHGQYLHAKRLRFIHPNGQPMVFDSDLPADFQQLIDRLRRQTK